MNVIHQVDGRGSSETSTSLVLVSATLVPSTRLLPRLLPLLQQQQQQQLLLLLGVAVAAVVVA